MKYLITILTILFPYFLFSQTVNEQFVGYGNVASVSSLGGGLYTVSITGFVGSPRFEPNGTWAASDVAVNDVVFIDGARHVITIVNSAGASTMNIRVSNVDEGLGVSALTNGAIVAIGREFTSGLFPMPRQGDGVGTGVPPALASSIEIHNAKIMNSLGIDYITTDSFSTFTNSATFSSIPIGKTVWRTTTGSRFEKTSSTTMVQRSTDNGLNASTIPNISNDTLVFNARLNNRVQMTTGNVSNAYVLDPLYYNVQAVGEIFVIGVAAGTSAVTVNWSSLYGIYTGTTFTGMPTTIVPAQSVMTFAFRVITTSAEVVKFQYVDGLNTNTLPVTLDIAYNNSGTSPKINVDGNGGVNGLEFETTSNNNIIFDSQNNGAFIIQDDGVDKVYIDSAGNFFLKVTPAAGQGFAFGTNAGRVIRADNANTILQLGPNGFVTIDGDNRLISGNQQLTLRSQTTSANQFGVMVSNLNNITSTTGGLMQIGTGLTYAPTSGSGFWSLCEITGTLNQTGSASQAMVGINIRPTVQGLLGTFTSIRDTTSFGWGIYQDKATKKNYFNSLSGFGTTSPTTKVHINGLGQLRYVDTNQAAGKSLISDVDGVATWRSMYTNTTATTNVTTSLGVQNTPFLFVEVGAIGSGQTNTIIELPAFATGPELVTIKFGSMIENAVIEGNGSETIDGVANYTVFAQPQLSISFKKGASEYRIQ